MSDKVILLVEDNPDNEALTLRALKKIFLMKLLWRTVVKQRWNACLARETMKVIASYENGASSHACKPVDINPFIETVKQPGLYWLVLNEVPAKQGEN